MSRFYASIQGSRGLATRAGDKSSGMDGHVRGWDVGVSVHCYYDEENDRDVCDVWKTGGSRNPSKLKQIGRVYDRGRA